MKSKYIFSISLLFVFLIVSISAVSQSNINSDSLVEQICKTVNRNKVKADSASVVKLFTKHLSHYANFLNNAELDSLFTLCYFRLQANCKEFKKIIDELNPTKGDWNSVENIPRANISIEECNQFFEINKFKYLEYSGDTTQVVITTNSWTDFFTDGTTSKLSFKKKSSCEFEISFIESNNISRKNMSKPGDKYNYIILEKNKNYFLLLVTYPSKNFRSTFKMYY